MRSDLAKWLAIGSGVLIVLLSALFAWQQNP